MKRNKESFIQEINKYLMGNLKSNPSFNGIKLMSYNEDYECFDFKFGTKVYLVSFTEKADFSQKPFIQVRDFSRDTYSLLQYTLDDSNFIIEKDSFQIIQNRGTTIGRRILGFEKEFKELMYRNGFNRDAIITSGNVSNPDFNKILNEMFYWMEIRINTKLKLEDKYRNIENETSDEVILEIESKTEGGKRVVISVQSERDPSLRKDAIKLHGTSCKVCSFNFSKTYGKWAEEFIEVHHVRPLSTTKSQVTTNPQTDLTVVCSNCHRMIHKKKGITLTVEELKNKLMLKK